MNQAILIILVPAAIVGVLYILVFNWMGYDIGLAPFVGTGVAFVGALAGVWRHKRRQRQKQDGQGE